MNSIKFKKWSKVAISLFCTISIIACQNQEKMENKTKNEFTPLSYNEAINKADKILKQLTLEEKIEMIGGHNLFFTKGLEKHNIPELYFSDATQGIHIRRDLPGQMEKSVAFPCGIALTATWNKALAYDYAKSIGEECRAGGIHVLLGPGMNIYRISQNGRNFEYFGEDPFLAARMIENYVPGVQSTGTAATLKHFVANNTDYNRRKSNSILDERTLHEIYLPAFKAGVDAGAMAVMTSYNLINGDWAAESEYLINELLRKRLGFKWLVMSDWMSINSPEKAMKSGLDLDMPGSPWNKNEAIDSADNVYLRTSAERLLKEGMIEEKNIDRMVRNILATEIAMKFDQGEFKDTSLLANFPMHEEVALQTAREGIVLLKNDENMLPLKNEKIKNLLLTGEYTKKLAYGGGSGEVEGYNLVMMLDAFKNEFGEKLNYVKEPTLKQIEEAEYVIVSVGTYDSEGWDKPFNLSDSVNNKILEYASANKNIIVVVNTGRGINMTSWNDKVSAILYAWYPGQNGNTALAEIIAGKVNPSGKLPISIEKKFEDSPGYPYIPEGEELYEGWPNDGDPKMPVYDVEYKEGILVGYRWYDTKNIEPLYYFGHGLSYTNFEYADLKTELKGTIKDFSVSVEFTIKNTGDFEGAEIAQLYVSDIESSVVRPIKELKGFEKISLKAGESKVIKIKLKKDDFAYWNSEIKDWKVEDGEFEIIIGSSSAKSELSSKILIQ